MLLQGHINFCLQSYVGGLHPCASPTIPAISVLPILVSVELMCLTIDRLLWLMVCEYNDYHSGKKMQKFFSILSLWVAWHKRYRHKMMQQFSEITQSRVLNGAKLESEHCFP